MKKPVIYYHLWPIGEWERINREIFERIVNSGLANAMDVMYICVNSDIQHDLINLHGISRDKVKFIKVEDTRSEWPTLDLLYKNQVSTENTPILYLHCKGARFNANENAYHPINSWTRGMTYFNVARWKKCIQHLTNGRASVGIRVARMPMHHYSGNFWWINSNYLKLLKDPATQDHGFRNRHGAEFWIGRLGVNNLFDMDVKRTDFGYTKAIQPSAYEEIDRNSKNLCIYQIGNQDTTWASRLGIEYDIYSRALNLKNESSVEAYVRYIVDNYNQLPRINYFINSSTIYKIPNIEQLIKNNYVKFHSFGTMTYKDGKDGAPNHPGLPIAEIWKTLFTTECPESFDFSAGSMFVATRDEIRKHPIELYQLILKMVEDGRYLELDCCFERMWKVFFSGSLKSNLGERSLSSESSLNSSYEDLFIFSLDGKYGISIDIDSGWNSIINRCNKPKHLFVSGTIVSSELEELISSGFRLSGTTSSEYSEFKFNSWKAIAVDTEIFIKNKNRKKSFIDPFMKTLEEKLL